MGLNRRPHQKSRAGCTECRRRRIKCSEEKPTCSQCTRYTAPCVYLTPAPRKAPGTKAKAAELDSLSQPTPSSAVQVHSPAITIPSPAITIQPPPIHSSISQSPATTSTPISRDDTYSIPPSPCGPDTDYDHDPFSITDLALLHHWTISASMNLKGHPEADRVYRTVFPPLGVQFPFLMHMILATSALHMAYLEQAPSRAERLVVDATTHHNKAIQGFYHGLGILSPHNCHAVFATCMLNTPYILAVHGRAGSALGNTHPTSSAEEQRLMLGNDWIPMVRSIGAVFGSVWDDIKTGPLVPVYDLGSWDDIDISTLSNPDDDILRGLAAIWNTSGTLTVTAEHAAFYDDTLNHLRRTLAYWPSPQLDAAGKWSGPFVWMHSAPRQFFELLWQRQPPALVLWAYLGALLHRNEELWWAEGWGRRIVRGVAELLGPYWERWLVWPRERIGDGGDGVEGRGGGLGIPS